MVVYPEITHRYFETTSNWIAEAVLVAARKEHPTDELRIGQWHENVSPSRT